MFSIFVLIGCLLDQEEYDNLQDQLRDTSSSIPTDVEDTFDSGQVSEEDRPESTHYALFESNGCIEFGGDSSPLSQDSWSFSLRLAPESLAGAIDNTMFQVGGARMMIKAELQSLRLLFCPEISEGTVIEDLSDVNALCERYDLDEALTFESGDRITISYLEDKTLTLFHNNVCISSFNNVINRFDYDGAETRNLYFGCPTQGEGNTSFANYWKGGVDSLILFSEGLTLSEVEQLYTAEQSNSLVEHLRDSLQTVAHWNLGEDENGDVIDTFNFRNGSAIHVEFKEYDQVNE
ncbi:MAG: hypothetical protein CL916_07410 [Deltaproteobacteria bacterium]|nr:hypothetical protein [Deltaproteobacteria bacterium]